MCLKSVASATVVEPCAQGGFQKPWKPLRLPLKIAAILLENSFQYYLNRFAALAVLCAHLCLSQKDLQSGQNSLSAFFW